MNALAEFSQLTEGVCLVQMEKLTLLGAAILPEVRMLVPKREKLTLMAKRLSDIDKYDALYLLKNCFAIPKLTYMLRTIVVVDPKYIY